MGTNASTTISTLVIATVNCHLFFLFFFLFSNSYIFHGAPVTALAPLSTCNVPAFLVIIQASNDVITGQIVYRITG